MVLSLLCKSQVHCRTYKTDNFARRVPASRRSRIQVHSAQVARETERNKVDARKQSTAFFSSVLPGAVPFLGHTLLIAQLNGKGVSKEGLTELFLRAREYGTAVRFKFLTADGWFLNDPHLITEMAMKRSSKYKERFVPDSLGLPYSLRETGFGTAEAEGTDLTQGIVFARGGLHARNRAAAMRSLSSRATRERTEAVVAELAAKLRDRWLGAGAEALRGGVRVDFEAQRFTFDVIGQAALSHDFAELDSPFGGQGRQNGFARELSRSTEAIWDATINDPLNLWRLFETRAKSDIREPMKYMMEFEKALIDERRRAIAGGAPPGDDFLGAMLEARDETGAPVRIHEIKWAVHDMIAAGSDTTASSLAAALAMLAANPEAQSALREELRPLGGRVPAAGELERLPYLEAVVRETLRLYPAASVFGRSNTDEEDDLMGLRIQPGAVLFASPFVLGRSPEWWNDPHKFDPSRFLPGGEWGTTTPRNAWIPFGLGARSCVGGQLALLEMKTALAALVPHFEFLPLEGEQTALREDGSLDIRYDITMAFPDGLKLVVKPLGAGSE
mmetsp:Transcript_6052/g.14656  ORF Transcript_6052/g.14656 Transcript_6052/m.14656 type:complete len:560 (-) Transcript_6052:166-1845(-)